MVIYDFLSLKNFLPIVLGFIVILFFLFIGVALLKYLIKSKSKLKEYWLLYLMAFVITLVGSFITLGSIQNLYVQYNQFVKPYYNEEYLVIEGTVKNYKNEDRDYSFYINDVCFEYSSFYLNDLGFNNYDEHIFNGNEIIVEYVQVENRVDKDGSDNVIMKITEK